MNKGTTSKVIKDCIHSHVTIPPLCVKFLDQPEFQRLRRVKQLGNVSRVYPSATHTRFEHSIGAMHLAGEMCASLKVKEEKSERVIHLVQLAALYHDIGHLPYSHLFDHILQLVSTDHCSIPLHHEERSIMILRSVSERLKDELTIDELTFVESCILGQQPSKEILKTCYNDEIHKENDAYLYQIVSSEVDVDRLDYLCRDAYHSGMSSFQANYIILNARVDKKTRKIAFRKNAEHDIKNMFEMRERMHHTVYQHPVSLEYDRLYTCMIDTLVGRMAIKLTYELDDYELDTLLRTHVATRDTFRRMETREKDLCQHDYHLKEKYIPSCGTIKNVLFIE